VEGARLLARLVGPKLAEHLHEPGLTGIARDSRRAAASPTWLTLLTRMLTTNLDGPGSTWINLPPVSSASRPVRRSWTLVDSPDLATDQKVGGSSPSERANVFPVQHVEPSELTSPPVPSGRILAALVIPTASFRRSA
jgi:hypothetical protein